MNPFVVRIMLWPLSQSAPRWERNPQAGDAACRKATSTSIASVDDKVTPTWYSDDPKVNLSCSWLHYWALSNPVPAMVIGYLSGTAPVWTTLIDRYNGVDYNGRGYRCIFHFTSWSLFAAPPRFPEPVPNFYCNSNVN